MSVDGNKETRLALQCQLKQVEAKVEKLRLEDVDLRMRIKYMEDVKRDVEFDEATYQVWLIVQRTGLSEVEKAAAIAKVSLLRG
jgi:hypothetical protein